VKIKAICELKHNDSPDYEKKQRNKQKHNRCRKTTVSKRLPVLSIGPGICQSFVGHSVKNCYLYQQFLDIGTLAALEEVAMGFF